MWQELELPDLLEALDARTRACLPEAVQQELEEVQSIGGQAHLAGILSEIGQIRQGLEKELSECQAALDMDASADAGAQAQFGEHWRLLPATVVAKPYWDRVAEFRCGLRCVSL